MEYIACGLIYHSERLHNMEVSTVPDIALSHDADLSALARYCTILPLPQF